MVEGVYTTGEPGGVVDGACGYKTQRTTGRSRACVSCVVKQRRLFKERGMHHTKYEIRVCAICWWRALLYMAELRRQITEHECGQDYTGLFRGLRHASWRRLLERNSCDVAEA